MNHPFAQILRTPGVARLLVSSVLGRLPLGINALAIVLFLSRETGSYGLAGLVAGATALGSALGAPVQGRLVDRFGQRSVLLPLAVVHAAGLVALFALGGAGAPAAPLIVAALLTGLAFPPTGAVLRALWPSVLRRELVSPAFALDTVVTELIFVSGPLVVAVFVALLDPGTALLASALAVIAGTLAFTTAPASRAWEPDRTAARTAGLGALKSPGVRTLMLSTLPIGFCFGAVEVTLPAFSDAEGSAELAGLLLALWSGGSAVGGLLYGARPRRRPLTQVHLWLAAILPLGYLPLAAAPSIPLMAVLVIPAGAAIAPLLATRNELVGSVAPPGAITEAYTWPVTALVSGIALGSAAAGSVVEAADPPTAFLMATGAAAVGALVAFARRETLVVAPA